MTENHSTAHDDAHNAFMALPPYSSIKGGQTPELGRGLKPCGRAFA